MSQPKSNEEAKKLIKKHVDAMTALAILDTKSDLWEQAWEELDALLDGILAQKDKEVTEAVKAEQKKIWDMLCEAMVGKLHIKKSDFGDLVDYLDAALSTPKE